MDPVNIYNTFINYGNGYRENLDTKELHKRLENKIKKNKLDKLISTLDSMDNKKDGYIEFEDLNKGENSPFRLVLDKCFGIPKERGNIDAKFSELDITRIFGGDFTKELELTAIALQEIDEEKKVKRETETAEIPADILNKLSVNDGMKVLKLESGYKTEFDNIITYYNENGDFLKKETENAKNEVIAELGKTEGRYFPVVPMLKNVSVNKELPDQTDFEILYNNDGEAVDIKLNSDTLIKFDDNNKNLLLDMINNGKEFGFNYNIQVDGYSVIVSELENQ